jgi:hypothetical protein
MREPIDLHETAPGHWEAEEPLEHREVMHAQYRRPRRRPGDDAGLGYVLLIVAIFAITGLFRLLGITG